MPKRLFASLVLFLAALAPAQAEQRQYGLYDVYYSVFTADFLQPEVAGALGIVRAPDRAVLNVAVRRRQPGAAGDTAVQAAVNGTRGDLIRKTPLQFRAVEEPGAAYYLADFPFTDGETVYLELGILPAGEATPLELRFQKVLYVEPRK